MKSLTLLMLCYFLVFENPLLFGQYTNIYNFNLENDLASNYVSSKPVFDGTWLYDITDSGGAYGSGCIFKIRADGTGFNKILDFDGVNGSSPRGSLTIYDSVLYGTTYSGGTESNGTIFRINTNGTGYTKLHDFDGINGANPTGALTLSGSILYGITSYGGTDSKGTIFRINTNGTGFNKLLDFEGTLNGSNPLESLIRSGNLLLGMTSNGGSYGLGTIFSIDTNGIVYTKLLDFDGTNGSNPLGSLSISDSVLFGMTHGGGAIAHQGTIFTINLDGKEFETINHFWGTSGCFPYGSLTLSGTLLYGMTNIGGTYDCGTIFKMNTDGTGYTILTNFEGSVNGSYPKGTLTLSGNSLYGTTSMGGGGTGELFKLNIDGSDFTKILLFQKSITGFSPNGSLTYSDTVLYGMTSNGGIYGLGTIFKVNLGGTGYTKLFDFDGVNGSNPYGSLTLVDSVFYGMAHSGGASLAGTIFRINTNGTGYTKLHDFDYINGAFPLGSLTFSGTQLCGMTPLGGIFNSGVVFKINIDGTGYIKLLDFDGTENGRSPSGSLILSDSFLYGMTYDKGANQFGTIFKINVDGTGYSKMYDFDGSNGAYPEGSLTISGSTLYGLTRQGGIYSGGSIFQINTDGSGFKKLRDLDSGSGGHPSGSLTLSGNLLYGMTNDHGENGFGIISHGYGTIFKINTDGTGFEKLHDFDGINGKNPYYTDLVFNSNTLYGMTESGGSMNGGVIFKYDLSGSSVDDNKSHPSINLGQNYPNPFNKSTEINFTLEKPGHITLSVINTLGIEIDIIADEYFKEGTYTKSWAPFNLADGIYYYKLQVEGCNMTKKMIKQK